MYNLIARKDYFYVFLTTGLFYYWYPITHFIYNRTYKLATTLIFHLKSFELSLGFLFFLIMVVKCGVITKAKSGMATKK